MSFAEIIGFVAATLTTLSFYPQAYKIIKTRDTASISLVMYSIINVGLILWLVYGLMIGDMPIILANAFTLLASLTILFLKIKR
jgi:MtN3 and saliva related transmembrane protein